MSARSRTTNRNTTSNQKKTGPSAGDDQLRLLPGGSVGMRPDWHLDERTRTVGLLGVEQAREVLRRARPPEPKQPQPVRKAS